MRPWIYRLLLTSSSSLLLTFPSCTRETESSSPQGQESHTNHTLGAFVRASKLPSVTSEKKSQLFTKISPEQSGIDSVTKLDLDHPLKYLYYYIWSSDTVFTGDFNGDQKQDIFITSAPSQNRLYLNLGDWKFKEVAADAKIAGSKNIFSAGGAVGDIDSDGDLDIYVCNYMSGNQLFLNQGNSADGTPLFKELALPAGIDLKSSCITANFCDYDKDGDLDIFVLTNRIYRAEGEVEKAGAYIDGKLTVKPEYRDYYGVTELNGKETITTIGQNGVLYRNEGLNTDGIPKFSDVSEQSGMDLPSYGLSATWWDYNQDGWLDLFIANDYRYPDRLMKNMGDGTFKNVAKDVLPATPYFSMGSAIADFDRDGRDDLFALDMSATTHYKAKTTMGGLTNTDLHVLDHSLPRQNMRNFLYLNSGNGALRELAFQNKIASSDWSWTPLAEDFDGDGNVDIIITNGVVRNFTDADAPTTDKDGNPLTGFETEWTPYENKPPNPEKNMAFKNIGAAKFKNVSEKWGLDENSVTYGASTADFDGDGDLDIVMTNFEKPLLLYKNNNTSENKVVIKLQDPESFNKDALGARVTIQTSSGIQTKLLNPHNGFMNANEAQLFFGLGDDTSIQAMAIEWPDGDNYQIIQNLKAGYRYEVKRDRNAPPKPPKPPFATLFTEVPSPFGTLRHHEKFHDDFVQQNLLPWKQSMQGPGHAWGDLDGDGRDDFVATNGAGSVDFAFLTNSRATGKTHHTFSNHAAGETNAALLFDANGDGHLDIYFSRGSYEFAENAAIQKDLLYLGDGNGGFTLNSDALPENFDVSGHLTAADYDRDGDLDLFVAGKVIPGQYPLAPMSRLLRNDSENGVAKFTDISASVFPEAMQKVPPMMNSAIWSDVDADGWIDLMLATENGPVRWLRNNEGTFEDLTEKAGLAKYSGWWNSICAADIDNDGDMDYIAGNLGKNTKYKPTMEKPNLVYYGDLDGSGKRTIMEAKSQKAKDRPLPVRGRF